MMGARCKVWGNKLFYVDFIVTIVLELISPIYYIIIMNTCYMCLAEQTVLCLLINDCFELVSLVYYIIKPVYIL